MQTMNDMRRHEVETFSILLAFCEGNSPFNGVFPSQRSIHADRWYFLWSTPEKKMVEKNSEVAGDLSCDEPQQNNEQKHHAFHRN